MAVDEAARHQLYTSLESTLGPEPTSTLMSLLPPVGWADVATRQDLVAFRDGLRAEIADLRTEVRTGIADSRAEFRTELRTGLAEASVERANLRSELKSDIAQLRGEMHTSIRNAVFAMIGAMFTLAGLTWAATSLT